MIPGIHLVVVAMLGAPPPSASEPRNSGDEPQCTLPSALVTVAELPEASGIAASRRVPGRFWAHNDSGKPELIALDAKGAMTGRVMLQGASVDDWEAMAVGACPAGSCLYVGDIGDNDAKRKRVTVYRAPEPENASQTAVNAEAFHATYPDGAHDAEALLVSGDGRLYIVTKGDTGAIALYAFPKEMKNGETVQLTRVGDPRGPAKPPVSDRITDGAVSADGRWVVLRTTQHVAFHPAKALFAGQWEESHRVDLRPLREPQGEGVTFAADGTLYLVGEGGSKKRPGTLAHLECTAATP